jgi:hypothetical protein
MVLHAVRHEKIIFVIILDNAVPVLVTISGEVGNNLSELGN